MADCVGACALGKDLYHESSGKDLRSGGLCEMATEPTPTGKADSVFGDSGGDSGKLARAPGKDLGLHGLFEEVLQMVTEGKAKAVLGDSGEISAKLESDG